MPDKQKTVAVSIPTYQREKQLILLLKSISAQNDLPEGYSFEILVVNNNPESYWDRVVDALADPPFAMHCIDVQPRGFAHVRNAAVTWVLDRNMDAIIFVDDDEVVPTGWLAAMVKAWERHQGDIITGPVVQILPPSVPRLVKKLDLLQTGLNAESGKKMAYANSNNTLVSRRVLDVMGAAFHPDLNRSGGEDTLFFHQCHLRGFDIYWDNSVLIGEPTPPERTTMAYVLHRWFNYGMNDLAIQKILYPNRWRPAALRRAKKASVIVIKGFFAAIVRSDYRRLGNTLCRLSQLAGLVTHLAGIKTVNRIYNPIAPDQMRRS
jgi:glycosyltransferase involved in cell wall biosynthesis